MDIFAFPREVVCLILEKMDLAELKNLRLALRTDQRTWVFELVWKQLVKNSNILKLTPEFISGTDDGRVFPLKSVQIAYNESDARWISLRGYSRKVLELLLDSSKPTEALVVDSITRTRFLSRLFECTQFVKSLTICQSVAEYEMQLPTLHRCTELRILTPRGHISKRVVQFGRGIYNATPNVQSLTVGASSQSILTYEGEEDEDPHWPCLTSIQTTGRSGTTPSSFPIWVPLTSWIFDARRHLTKISLLQVDVPSSPLLSIILNNHADSLQTLELSLAIAENSQAVPFPDMPNLKVLRLVKCEIDFAWPGNFGFGQTFMLESALRAQFPSLEIFEFTVTADISFTMVRRIFNFHRGQQFHQILSLTLTKPYNDEARTAWTQELQASFPNATIN